jgi:hypothetical protein
MDHARLHRYDFGTNLLQHCEASLFRHYRGQMLSAMEALERLQQLESITPPR